MRNSHRDNSSCDAVLTLARDGAILEANTSAERAFGRARAELVGSHLDGILFSPGAEPRNQSCNAPVEDFEPRRAGNKLPLAGRRKDGSEFAVEIEWRRQERDGAAGDLVILHDVTQRERILRDIVADPLLLNTVLRNAFDILWELTCEEDMGDSRITVSHDISIALGFNPGEIPLAIPFNDWRNWVHPADAREAAQLADQTKGNGGAIQLKCRLRRKDQAYEWWEFHAVPANPGEGARRRWVGVARPVITHDPLGPELLPAIKEPPLAKSVPETDNLLLREEIERASGYEEIVGFSQALTQVLHRVAHVAATDSVVLIMGETGTGKEIVAHAIYRGSRRNKRPFITLNCAALPLNLMESELFGHEKGAFTGASSSRMGRFELAQGGTIFLDEVGELQPEAQAKLLRVLETGEFERVGSTQTRRTDARVIAATNAELMQAVERGSFRRDLFYRLNVFPITMPPLRERREDIPLLVSYIARKKAMAFGKAVTHIPRRVMAKLVEYDWPGNVRELENLIERALILTQGPVLDFDDILDTLSSTKEAIVLRQDPDESSSSGAGGELADIERKHITRVCETCGWRIKGAGAAAEKLGLNPSTLYFRMKKLGIARPPGGGAICAPASVHT